MTRASPPHPHCPRCRRVRRVLSAAALSAALLAVVAWGLALAAPPPATATATVSRPPPPPPVLPPAPVAAETSPRAASLPASDDHGAACRPATETSQACVAAREPVALDVPYAWLPTAHEGTPYQGRVNAKGGSQRYRYRIVDGALPPGLGLDAQGQFTGTPTAAGIFRFKVSASDTSSPPLEDTREYRLNVAPRNVAPKIAASKPAPPAHAPPASAPAPRKEDGAALLRQASDNQVTVYQLRKEDIEALMPAPDGAPPATDAAPDAPAAASAPAPASDTVETALDPVLYQWLHDALSSMQGIEYPTQSLFEHALDARLAQSARTAGDRPAEPQCKDCSVPASLRDAIVKAAQRHYDESSAAEQRWEGGGCGCRLDGLSAEVYGFQPFWSGAGAPQRMDFSVLTRVGYFALPFDAFGTLPQPLQWSAAQADFVRVAHDHGTKVDLVLYRSRWDALLKLSEETRDRIAHEVPRNAVQLIRTSMTGWRAGVERHLPGFAHEPRMGDGITVFFDGMPTDADGAVAQRNFDRFFDTFVLTLIEEMRRGGEPYALNLVIPSQAMGHGAFAFSVLSGYIRKAEEPPLEDGQIIKDGVAYRSRTNLTLQFLVPMPEPVTQTKRELRAYIEESPALHGNDRRVFLRKVVPLLPIDGRDLKQLGDDLVYFQDNFGGVGLWPVPQRTTALGDAINVKLRQVYSQASVSEIDGLCRFVCPQRWLLRLAFELLLLAAILAFLAYAFDCRVRRLAGGYAPLAFVGIAVIVVLGGALLSCDPALTALREGNDMLLILIAILIGWGLLASLKRRVEQP